MNFKTIIESLYLQTQCLSYNIRFLSLKNKIFKKERINVVFFVLYDSMWKSDILFELLQNSKRFNPYIVSTPYPNHPYKFRKENQEKLEKIFKLKGFNYINGYDFENEEWFDINQIDPDIVFYQQPYNGGYRGFNIQALWHKCIFGYIPYCYDLETCSVFYNNLLQNIAWKLFLPTIFEKEMVEKMLYNKGKNIEVPGYPLSDMIISEVRENDYDKWKLRDRNIKRIIWAPHHSILETDALNYSNFLEIADDMLLLAEKYRDRVQFIFKPHPVLKRKLYNHSDWGVDKTEKYYNTWRDSENSAMVEGEYIDIFKTSDGMIHDSASFTAEYLYTGKPVLFISKPGHEKVLSDFGKHCYDLHYKTSTIEGIKDYIDTVVIGGNDKMKDARQHFVKKYMLPINGKLVAENIFDVFMKELL